MRGLMLAWLLSLLALASAAQAQDCRDLTHAGDRYTLCEVDAAKADIRLFLRDDTGPFGTFTRVEDHVAEQGLQLQLAMNAGMFHRDLSPVGLYLAEGEEEMRLVPNPGPGNFGLLPNGVFCIREGRADVIETLAFQANPPDCRYATQSGPMLVIDGALHPKFLKDSDSKYVRNGVGTSADGQRVVFAISNDPVRFYDFATLYRDVLGLPQALFFDGKVSRAYIPALDRRDLGFPMGPIVGVVQPQ